MLRHVLVLTSVFLSSCGSSSNSDDQSDKTVVFNDIEFVTIAGSELEVAPKLLEGTGSMVALNPLASIDSGNSFTIGGSLAEGASVELVANADKSLLGGLQFVFKRNADKLEGSIVFGSESVSITEYIGTQNPQEFGLILDVHNDESPAHVMIWPSSVSDFSEETAIFNSEDAVEVPGNGTGTYWGIKNSEAEVVTLSLTEPKFEEE